VLHGHAASETLRGIQGDAADMIDIELHQHLDGDPRLLPCVQQRVDGRQPVIEPRIDYASAHRRDHAVIRGLGSVNGHCRMGHFSASRLDAMQAISSFQDLTNDLAPSSWSWAARALIPFQRKPPWSAAIPTRIMVP